MKKNTSALLCTLICTFLLSACDRSNTTSTVPPLPTAQCTLNIPQAPQPLPPGFNWRPLAQRWCDQLQQCGFASSDCVNVYLDTINNLPTTATAAPSGGVTAPAQTDASIPLACEDSEEFHAGQTTCGMEQRYKQRAQDS